MGSNYGTIREAKKRIAVTALESGDETGRAPSELSEDDWRILQHKKTPLLKIIRKKCLDCSHTMTEVRRCASWDCSLWPYRMGSNPFRSERSDAQIEASKKSADALKAMRAGNESKIEDKIDQA